MSLNILVVDDSLTVFEVLQKTLRLAKIPTRSLHHATNGKMALKILEEQWIDLVFADLHMPEMGGVELINTMRERNLLPSIPVIVVSAEGNRQVIDQLLGLGARAFVRKPFSPEEIQAVIAEILELAMHDQVAGFIEGAFLEVLANYAFLFGDRVDKESLVVDEAGDFIRAWIDILSNDRSHLDVVVPRDLAHAISANVLGVEFEDPLARDRAEDAVKEMINVLCGHLRTLLTHESGLFEAAIPCIQRISVLEWMKIRDSKDSLAFLIEDYPLLLILSMEGQER